MFILTKMISYLENTWERFKELFNIKYQKQIDMIIIWALQITLASSKYIEIRPHLIVLLLWGLNKKINIFQD